MSQRDVLAMMKKLLLLKTHVKNLKIFDSLNESRRNISKSIICNLK